ncbi:sialidase family protein [Pirellulaceae bacterium SH449]
MTNKLIVLIVLAGLATACWSLMAKPTFAQVTSDEPRTIVFEAGMNGFASIRIPSVILTKQSTLLAFAEGRAADRDQAFNKILLRRSRDLGKTWGELAIIAEDQNAALNNPCAVVEQESGTIFLTYQSYPGTLSEQSGQIETGYIGDSIVRCWLISSTDDGATWTAPREITRSAKRETIVTTIASGPGVGIQLTNGGYRGRLVFPFNEGPYGLWNIYVVYSDDHGTTWQMGDIVPGGIVESSGKRTSQVNECQVVELADGRLLMNARRWAGAPVRKGAISDDGGESWSPVFDVQEQRDPSCMGSIIRVAHPDPDALPVLLYSGPNSDKREKGTITISTDQGQSWTKSNLIEPGLFAYSCLVALPEGMVGCLYEGDDMAKIIWKEISLDVLLRE